ncbi:MAG TPA: nucleotidyltransferase domain-containing protein [Stellaceae bacterium]|nr:nucleotidyltransferase domain-containing protein [Stellaceae bacterium]
MAPMLAIDDPSLIKVLERIVPAMQPEAVYLFGSRARGTFREESDYDLLMVMPDDTPPEKLNMLRAFEATRGLGVAVEVIACRRSIFERKKLVPGTLSRTVWAEGRLVYGH